jgi:L-alanine-DL-glutamate epimerase-like enolase superfamily enzyme
MTTTAGLRWEKITLNLQNPFRLSYGISHTRQTYWLRLEDDAGWGEGTIPPYYGIDTKEMETYWRHTAALARPLPDDLDTVEGWLGAEGPAPARTALEMVVIDRIARQREIPLYDILGISQPANLESSYTISIDTPDEMARMAAEVKDFKVLKVKLGSEDDTARLAAIRAARPDARLRVDANAGWTVAEAAHQIEEISAYELEMIEQPLTRIAIEAMGELQKRTSTPIVADESVQTIEDIEKLGAAGVKGINLKLMKAGGLLATLQMIQRARELGMKIMLGCMVETSLGTTAMAHLSGLADWVDLDAPLLISNDPFEGITYDKNLRISVPERPGIGAVKKPSEAV